MNLIKTSFLSALETGIKLASGFLVLKYLSIKTGPEGIATFGQFQNFVAATTATCAGAFTTGLVRYVSESYKQGASRTYVERATGFASLLLAIVALPLLLFPGSLSDLIFGTTDFAWAFICLALAMPLGVLFQIALALLNGSGQVRELIISKSASSLLLLALSVLLVTFFGLAGGLASLVLAPASAIIVAFLLLGRAPSQIDWTWFKPKLDTTGLRQFGPYWIMSMTTVVSTPVVLMLVRTSIGDQLGWTSAGYWEASWRIAELYLLVITTALSVYYIPRLSQLAAGRQERRLVLKTVAFASSTSAVLALGIYVLRDFVVAIMFSSDFLPVADILAPQLLGSIVRIGCWVIAYHMIVRGKVALMVLSELFFGFTLYASSVYLTHEVGLIGASYAFLANALAYMCFSVLYYLLAIGRPRHKEMEQ